MPLFIQLTRHKETDGVGGKVWVNISVVESIEQDEKWTILGFREYGIFVTESLDHILSLIPKDHPNVR